MRFLPALICLFPSLALAGGVIWSDRFPTLYTGLDTPHGLVLDIPARKLYWADTGTNNVTWRDNVQGPYTVEVSATADDDGLELVTVRSAAPLDIAPAQFLRVEAVQLVVAPARASLANGEADPTSERLKPRPKNRRTRTTH